MSLINYKLLQNIYSYNHTSDTTSSDIYVQAQHDRPCCIDDTEDGYHRGCACLNIPEKEECQEICTNDSKCKGYAITNDPGIKPFCYIATTIERCPAGCDGPHKTTNIGPLDPQGQCGRVAGLWNGGCHIKQGWHFKIANFSLTLEIYLFA